MILLRILTHDLIRVCRRFVAGREVDRGWHSSSIQLLYSDPNFEIGTRSFQFFCDAAATPKSKLRASCREVSSSRLRTALLAGARTVWLALAQQLPSAWALKAIGSGPSAPAFPSLHDERLAATGQTLLAAACGGESTCLEHPSSRSLASACMLSTSRESASRG